MQAHGIRELERRQARRRRGEHFGDAPARWLGEHLSGCGRASGVACAKTGTFIRRDRGVRHFSHSSSKKHLVMLLPYQVDKLLVEELDMKLPGGWFQRGITIGGVGFVVVATLLVVGAPAKPGRQGSASVPGGVPAATASASTTHTNHTTLISAPAAAGETALPEGVVRNTQSPNAPAYHPGVQRVSLDMTEKKVEIAPGKIVTVWTFGDQVPGPVIRVRVGDTVKVTIPTRRRSRTRSTSTRPASRRTGPSVTSPPARASASSSRPRRRACSCTTAARPRWSTTSPTACTG